MTLRRSDSLPTKLQAQPVSNDHESADPPTKTTPDSDTVPNSDHVPAREEVIATWKSLHTDVSKIKNGFASEIAPTDRNANRKQTITRNFIPAFMCNNRDVRRKITYDNRARFGEEPDQSLSFPLDPSQTNAVERGTASIRRRNLLQRLFSWKTQQCDCKERYTPKYQTRRLRPEDLLCTCGASANRLNLAEKTNNKYSERGRSKSVGYEAAREVAQFRRCASAGATVGAETAAALRARAALTLARRYYPEGGWGWTITVVGTIVQVLSHGLQLGGGTGAIACAAAVKFRVPPLYTHGRSLQIKWKNLRDAFMKECRRQKNIKSGAGAKKNNQYRFYNQLLFLKPYAGKNKTQNSLSAGDDESVGEGNESVGGPYEDRALGTKRKKSDPAEEMTRELIDTLKTSINKKENEEDPDRQFMLSLVPDFKKVPDRLKSVVKINIIRYISQAQDEMYNYKESGDATMSYTNNRNQGYYTNTSSYAHQQNEQGTSAAGIADNIIEAIPATPTTVNSNITDESEILSLF